MNTHNTSSSSSTHTSLEETSKQLKVRGYKVTEEYDENGRLSKVSGEPPALKTWFGRSRWDWLQVFLQLLTAAALPVALFFATQSFASQQDNANKLAAQDQQREAALQAYLDHMSDLLLGNNTGKESPSLASAKSTDEISEVASVQTLTILRNLDSHRKVIVIQFLYGAKLIGQAGFNPGFRISPIIILSGADLTGIDITNEFMMGIDLSGTNLSNAHLSGTDLSAAVLSGADLTHADLSNANLPLTNFSYAALIHANLSHSNLSGADFTGADLAYANLANTLTGSDILKGTKNCQEAILPKDAKCT